jgi:hypothetical protein
MTDVQISPPANAWKQGTMDESRLKGGCAVAFVEKDRTSGDLGES